MDYKEKVEWLGRYQASVSCQHMLEEEIEVLRSDAERVTACISGMPPSRFGSGSFCSAAETLLMIAIAVNTPKIVFFIQSAPCQNSAFFFY